MRALRLNGNDNEPVEVVASYTGNVVIKAGSELVVFGFQEMKDIYDNSGDFTAAKSYGYLLDPGEKIEFKVNTQENIYLAGSSTAYFLFE